MCIFFFGANEDELSVLEVLLDSNTQSPVIAFENFKIHGDSDYLDSDQSALQGEFQGSFISDNNNVYRFFFFVLLDIINQASCIWCFMTIVSNYIIIDFKLQQFSLGIGQYFLNHDS